MGCYYTYMETTFTCSVCLEDLPFSRYSTYGWANSDCCQACATEIDREWDTYQAARDTDEEYQPAPLDFDLPW